MIFDIIPKNSKPFTTSNIFSAVFNVPTAGGYDFTNVTANKAQHVFQMVNTSIYFIRSISFSATIPEGDFLSAIDISSKDNFPAWRLRFNSDRTIVHPYPFPVVQYFDDTDFSTFIWSQQAADFVDMDFLGLLTQTSDLVGISEIRAQVSIVVYEITDNNFLKAYRERSTPGFYKI